MRTDLTDVPDTVRMDALDRTDALETLKSEDQTNAESGEPPLKVFTELQKIEERRETHVTEEDHKDGEVQFGASNPI